MNRKAELERRTRETAIRVSLDLESAGPPQVSTGIAFFDHMLTLFAVHGFIDMTLHAQGDLEVDSHHTVTPMDEALAEVAVDLSRRPYLVFQLPACEGMDHTFNRGLAKEFFRALANHVGMNLHIIVPYGENEHHILEAVFKSCGRALRQAVSVDERISGVRSSKGML